MADHDSHLPVRSEKDGDDEGLRCKLMGNTDGESGDGDAALNQAAIDGEHNLHVQINGDRADDGLEVALRLSELGNANTDGIYEADDNSIPSSTGLVGLTRNDADSVGLLTDQVLKLTAKVGTVATGHATEPQTDDTRSLDVAIHDEAGNAYSAKNPLPVVMEESEGEEVHDHQTTAALAKDASTTLNYDLPGADTTGAATDRFLLKQVIVSASGKIKVELQLGDGAADVPGEAFVNKAVTFNSTADTQSGSIVLSTPLVLTAGADGQSVQVVITNRDQQAQDVYVTFVGVKYT